MIRDIDNNISGRDGISLAVSLLKRGYIILDFILRIQNQRKNVFPGCLLYLLETAKELAKTDNTIVRRIGVITVTVNAVFVAVYVMDDICDVILTTNEKVPDLKIRVFDNFIRAIRSKSYDEELAANVLCLAEVILLSQPKANHTIDIVQIKYVKEFVNLAEMIFLRHDYINDQLVAAIDELNRMLNNPLERTNFMKLRRHIAYSYKRAHSLGWGWGSECVPII